MVALALTAALVFLYWLVLRTVSRSISIHERPLRANGLDMRRVCE